MTRKKIRVIIEGRVQGVCFRMETQHAARRIGVTGWARNRRDGSVEAVFEGAPEKVEEMLAWCRKGPPLARVDDVAVRDADDQESFTDFTIRSTT
ncbi:MAG: acylphosphatase [Desulfobacteraceae bacterium]|jgi:acylphosphatase|nr:MAG: acylphosphatase [Desulfobacteraceae bacterium]